MSQYDGPEGFFRVSRELTTLGQAAPEALNATVRHFGYLGLAKVKGLASTGTHGANEGHLAGTGPGPNRVTGGYTRTMNVEFAQAWAGYQASIGTNADQAMRLEKGFTGVDSAGRHYDQPAYPHWWPAADWLETQFPTQMDATMKRVIPR